jgi:hypothetical protein
MIHSSIHAHKHQKRQELILSGDKIVPAEDTEPVQTLI